MYDKLLKPQQSFRITLYSHIQVTLLGKRATSTYLSHLAIVYGPVQQWKRASNAMRSIYSGATWHSIFNLFPVVPSSCATPCTGQSHRPPEVVEMYSSHLNTSNVITLRWLSGTDFRGPSLDYGVESLCRHLKQTSPRTRSASWPRVEVTRG